MEDLTPESIAEEMAETQQLSLTLHSTDFNSNHLEQQMQDDVRIEIGQIVRDNEHGRLLPSHCSIYRVLHPIRDVKEDAYTPRVVSIGPFHCRNLKLMDMEKQKQILFTRFTHNAMTSLDNLIRFVELLVSNVRDSYSENIELSEKELVKLVLVDAGFIIELFKSFYEENGLNEEVRLLQPCLLADIRMDLLLLENQLPFFVLEDLFNIAFPGNQHGNLPSFRGLTCYFFGYYNPRHLELDPNQTIYHFTDVLRLFYLPTERPQMIPWPEESKFFSYTATKLREAGIKLKSSTSRCLIDLRFTKHGLEIPQIWMDNRTEIIFRNMIALEQYHYPYRAYISNYAFMLDSLINTNKDTDLLISKEIFSNSIGDTKRGTLLFNSLAKNVTLDRFNSDYIKICRRLNNLCQDPCHMRVATLRRDYCSTTWQSAASLAGIILLILTLVQTIVAVRQLDLKK